MLIRKPMIPILAAALSLTACGSKDTPKEAEGAEGAADAATSATAELLDPEGKPVGTATLTETPQGLSLMLSVSGQTPGEHGIHVHATGDCTAPDFASAGGHWNPAATKHGLANPEGPHMGDLPNLSVAEDGTGSMLVDMAGGKIASGDNALLDADGAAFVIHAGKDDQATDPSGDSGARVACGVFSAG
ncbi:MAG: superoxide dismutase family protein [Blastomonas sp.]